MLPDALRLKVLSISLNIKCNQDAMDIVNSIDNIPSPDALHVKTISMVSLVYLNQVLEILDQSSEVRNTVTGIVQQTGFAAGGVAIGGLIGGRSGALFGALLGALVGYARADDYQSMVDVVRTLNDDEKHRLQEKIQALVGSASIEQLKVWMQSEAHRQMLTSLLSKAVTSA
uniref:Uncharacterized protein n=1 Tax=Plectus sambesii TaxID=2011161 RepID=A0A914VLU0_9BILA